MVVVELSNVVVSIEHAVIHHANPSLQQSAMKRLQEFENYDNFLESLLIILQNKEFLIDGRLLCAICLKNLVNRCWVNRNNNSRTITANEKTALRSFLTHHLDEPNTKISVQLAVLTAKIARYDWPSEWPELLNILFHEVSSGQSLQRFRSMSVLFHVLEELTSKRMRSNRESFTLITSQMFPVMVPVWREISGVVISTLPSLAQRPYPAEREEHTEALFAHLYTTIRVLHRLLLTGYTTICQQPDIMPFFEEFSSHLTQVVDFLRGNYRPQYCEDESDEEDDADGMEGGGGGEVTQVWRPNTDGVIVLNFLLRRIVRRMAQLPVELQKTHPLPVAQVLAPFLSLFAFLIHRQLSDDRPIIEAGPGPAARMQNTLLIATVLFFSNVLSCRAYVDPPLATPRRDSRRVSSDPEGCVGSSSPTRSPIARPPLSTLRERDVEHPRDDEKWFHMAHATMDAFFAPSRVAELLQLLLQRLLLLREEELFLWRTEPEEYTLRAQAETEADSVRTAAEGLFLGLLDKAPQVVIPRLMAHLQDGPAQLSAVRIGAEAAEVLSWDAVFLCAGLGVSELSRVSEYEGEGGDGDVNVDGEGEEEPASPRWLTEASGPALLALCGLEGAANGAGCVSGCPVLKRRLFWVLHCWAFTLDSSSVPLVARLLIDEICSEPAPSSGNVDLVVKLQAVDTLAALLSVPSFRPQMLAEHVAAAVRGLCQLSVRLEQSSFRARTVEVVGELVLALGLHVRPTLPALVEHLCALWSNSDWYVDEPTDCPLRPAILETLARIVRVGRADSSALHTRLLPVLHQVLGSGDEEVLGFADALTLWLAVVRNARGYVEDLGLLYSRCVVAWLARGEAAQSQQVTRDWTLINQAYAVQGGDLFLQSCGALLMQLTTSLLDQLSARSVSWVIRPVEALLQCAAVPVVGSVMRETQLLSWMLRACAACLPDFVAFAEFEQADVAVVEYLHVCARLLLYGDEALTSLRGAADDVAATVGLAGHSLLLGVVRLLLDKFDSMGSGGVNTGRRKVWVLALLALYPTDDPLLLSWLPEVFVLVDSVLCQLESEDADELSPPALALELMSFEAGVLDEAGGDLSDGDDQWVLQGVGAGGEPAVERLGVVLQGDPLCSSSGVLRGRARGVVEGVRGVLGDDRLGALFSSLDESVMRSVFASNDVGDGFGGSSSARVRSP